MGSAHSSHKGDVVVVRVHPQRPFRERKERPTMTIIRSLPPKNKDGSYRDERSNTVEDAADFERHFNSHILHDEGDEPDWDEDGDWDDDDDEDDDDYDRCKCSDPCCPCSGSKRGVP